MHSASFTPQQLQFFATTSSTVSILPTYNEGQIYLMGVHYLSSLLQKTIGPFKANHEEVVPFWLAVFLKEQQKCKILIPQWLHPQILLGFIERQNQQKDLIYLHEEYFFELAYHLLNRAPDSFEKPREIRNMIDSLETIRFQKMRELLENTNGNRRISKYVTSYELNKWREGLGMLEQTVQQLQNGKGKKY